MDLRIAKQPPWEQGAPRPAGFGISLIAATNASIKRLLLRVKVGEGKPEPEIQIQALQCLPQRSGAYIIAIGYFNKNPTLKAACTNTVRINELMSIFSSLIFLYDVADGLFLTSYGILLLIYKMYLSTFYFYFGSPSP